MIPLQKILRGIFILFLTLLPAALKGESLQLTPLTYRVLAEPVQPVLGSDGKYHLVYEIWLTNISPQAWKVERIEAFNEARKALLKLDGAELKSRLGPVSARGGSNELGPYQSAMAWLDLTVPSKDSLPQKIHHRFSVSGEGKVLNLAGAEAAVGSEEPPAIGAPLRGAHWLAGDGCCDSIRHVRAVLPINGKLHLSQRFAIDWEKLDEANRIYSGDAKNPESYFCYGQEILAVADGEVVEMLDGLPNQVPGKLPEGIGLAEADGNHVILKLTSGPYVLYAHMKPGSVRVKRGDRVQAGQVLGQVGNSGNTSEPHLHFQMMDGPSAMASNGIPYRIQSFELMGRAPSTEAFDKAAANGSPLQILPAPSPAKHRDQLPMDLSLVRFPD